MLHLETVPAPTLELLKKLSQLPCLSQFNLAGGTALALQIGHRISYDLDFFTSQDFEPDTLFAEINQHLQIQLLAKSKNTLNLTANSIKIDLLKYPYPLIDNILTINELRLLSKKDIAPMKISAICNRGAKRDFYDFYFGECKYIDRYYLVILRRFFDRKNERNYL